MDLEPLLLAALAVNLFIVAVYRRRQPSRGDCQRIWRAAPARRLPRTYLIILETREQEDVRRLDDRLRRFDTWAQVTDRGWSVVTSMPLPDLCEVIEAEIGPRARHFLTQSSGVAGWRWVLCRDAWLHENL